MYETGPGMSPGDDAINVRCESKTLVDDYAQIPACTDIRNTIIL
jgi:hypothetical protein